MTPEAVPVRAGGDNFDPAAGYKGKCVMRHGAKAGKKFDTTRTDEQHLKAIPKGKDGTPKLPAHEKTRNADQARSLVGYMQSLKQ